MRCNIESNWTLCFLRIWAVCYPSIAVLVLCTTTVLAKANPSLVVADLGSPASGQAATFQTCPVKFAISHVVTGLEERMNCHAVCIVEIPPAECGYSLSTDVNVLAWGIHVLANKRCERCLIWTISPFGGNDTPSSMRMYATRSRRLA